MNSLVIALFHAIPIAVVGLVTKKRSAINWTTGTMCVIAVASGDSRFVIANLVAIVIGYVLINQATNNAFRRKFKNTTGSQDRQSDIQEIKNHHEVKDEKKSRFAKKEYKKHSAIDGSSQAGRYIAQMHERLPLNLSRNIFDSDASTIKYANLKIGDKVKHRARPDAGVGLIIDIISDGTCAVEFSKSRFSGIPLNVIGTIEQIEAEKRVLEEEKQNQQEFREKEEIYFKIHNYENNRINNVERYKLAKEPSKDRLIDQKIKIKYINEKFSQYGISCLWHISHRENIKSILERGILNHDDAHRLHVNRVDISDPDAQKLRRRIENHYGRKIHEYAPLYINPRNPMLYVRRHLQNELCLVEISLSALSEGEYLISDGNAASRDTELYDSIDSLNCLPWDVLNAWYWSHLPDGRRRRCAEILIHPKVEPKYLEAIHCYSEDTLSRLANCGRKAKLSKIYFF